MTFSRPQQTAPRLRIEPGTSRTRVLHSTKSVPVRPTFKTVKINYSRAEICPHNVNSKYPPAICATTLLEYSSSVWDPWQEKYIEKVEMVQHMTVRYILNDYARTSSVTKVLKKLSLPTSETRRKISSLVGYR